MTWWRATSSLKLLFEINQPFLCEMSGCLSCRGQLKRKKIMEKKEQNAPLEQNKWAFLKWRGSLKPPWVHPDLGGGRSSQINVVSLGHVSEISAGFSASLEKHAARSLEWATAHLSAAVNNRWLKPDSCFWSLKPMTDHLTCAAGGHHSRPVPARHSQTFAWWDLKILSYCVAFIFICSFVYSLVFYLIAYPSVQLRMD